MSSSVVTTSSTLKRDAQDRRHAGPRPRRPARRTGSSPARAVGAGSQAWVADEGGGHGAGIELALAADVPEAGPKGDGDGEAR